VHDSSAPEDARCVRSVLLDAHKILNHGYVLRTTILAAFSFRSFRSRTRADHNSPAMAKLIVIAVALLACALPLAAASSRQQIPAEEGLELANGGRELQQYYNDVGEVKQKMLESWKPQCRASD
jgi:hypothetical protein